MILAVCKRIKGVSGDLIVYAKRHSASGALDIVKVPPGQVWLGGDNPSNSNDSRSYGPMPLGMLQGKLFCKIGRSPLHISKIDRIFMKSDEEVIRSDSKTPLEGSYRLEDLSPAHQQELLYRLRINQRPTSFELDAHLSRSQLYWTLQNKFVENARATAQDERITPSYPSEPS